VTDAWGIEHSAGCSHPAEPVDGLWQPWIFPDSLQVYRWHCPECGQTARASEEVQRYRRARAIAELGRTVPSKSRFGTTGTGAFRSALGASSGTPAAPTSSKSPVRKPGRPRGRSRSKKQIVDCYRLLRAQLGRGPTQSELAANLCGPDDRFTDATVRDWLTEYELSWPIE
jgi:hypothetical protein